MLLLQEYDFTVVHRPGSTHAVADYLSRLESGEEPTGVEDDFPDAQLFELEAVVPAAPRSWYDDMFHFVDTGRMRDGMSRDERKRLALKRRDFRIIADQLYKQGIDGVLRRCVTHMNRRSSWKKHTKESAVDTSQEK